MTSKEYISRIIELQRQRDYRAAYELVKEALDVYPGNPFFLRSEVFILFRLNKIKAARDKAEERISLLRDDEFFLKTYLSILEKRKAKDDIEQILERNILNRRFGSEDFYVFLFKLTSRNLGKEKGDEVLKRGLFLFPKSRSLMEFSDKLEKTGSSGSGYNFYKEKFKGKKPNEAIEEIENIRMLPKFENDHQLLIYLAELYKKINDVDKAIEVYQYLLKVRDDEFARKMLGYAYYKVADHDKALLYLRDIFLKYPDDHFLSSTILKIFEREKDFTGFENIINEALGRNPSAKHLHGLLKKANKWKGRVSQ